MGDMVTEGLSADNPQGRFIEDLQSVGVWDMLVIEV